MAIKMETPSKTYTHCIKCSTLKSSGIECQKCGAVYVKAEAAEEKRLIGNKKLDLNEEKAIGTTKSTQNDNINVGKFGEKIFKAIKYCAYGLVGYFVICGIYFGIVDGGWHSTKPVADNAESQYVEAIIAVQNNVKGHLKSPATADFPLPNYVKYSYLGDGKFAVSGHVDSQNTFGGVVRSNYSANATKSGPGQFDWIVENLIMK
jgi:hypothetical protein